MPVLRDNGVFCVNTLRAGGRSDRRHVRRPHQGARARSASTAANGPRSSTGSPVLASAVVAFDCRVIEVKSVATHNVIFGAVEAIHSGRPGRRWSITTAPTSRCERVLEVPVRPSSSLRRIEPRIRALGRHRNERAAARTLVRSAGETPRSRTMSQQNQNPNQNQQHQNDPQPGQPVAAAGRRAAASPASSPASRVSKAARASRVTSRPIRTAKSAIYGQAKPRRSAGLSLIPALATSCWAPGGKANSPGPAAGLCLQPWARERHCRCFTSTAIRRTIRRSTSSMSRRSRRARRSTTGRSARIATATCSRSC